MSRRPRIALYLVLAGLLALSACTTESNLADRFLLQISSAPPAAGGPTVDEVLKDGSLVVRWRVKKEDPPTVLNLGDEEYLSDLRNPFSDPIGLDLTALAKTHATELLFDVRIVSGDTTITQIEMTPIRLVLPGVASVHLTPPTDDSCTPDCADKDCGDDGCGKTCGDGCPADSPNCSELTDFKCTDCLPDCEGKSCGDDGCGGLCGIPDTANGCSSAFPVCNDGNCIAAPAGCESDSDCDDGDPCTVGEACSDGACVDGESRNCDDENVCTDDTCDPEVADGCVHTPAEATCDDGDPCNGVEACDADGECQVGEPVDCDDGNECTDDSCDSAQGGACVHTPNQGPCGCTDLVEGDVLSVFTADATQPNNPLDHPPLNTELSVINTDDGAIAGSVALRVVTTAAFAFDIDYNATAPMDVSESDELRLAIRGFNDNEFGWQEMEGDKPPIVTLRDQSGAERTLTPNQTQISTDGTWKALAIPLQGGSGWQASGDPVDLTSLMGFRLTLDTWGFGYTIDVDRARFVTSDATCSDTCAGGCVGGSCADDGVACIGATPVDDYICEASACTQKVCEPLESYCVTESLKGICNESGTGYAGEVTDLDDCQSPELAAEFAANWACIPDTGTCACVPKCEEGICGGLDGCGGYCGCKPELYCKVDSEFDIGIPGAMANVIGECADLTGLCDNPGHGFCEDDKAYVCAETPPPIGEPAPGAPLPAPMLVAHVMEDCPGAYDEFHVCAKHETDGYAKCVTCGEPGCLDGWLCGLDEAGEPACMVGPDCEPQCADSDIAGFVPCGDDGCGGVCGDETCGSETKVCAPLVEGAPSICQNMVCLPGAFFCDVSVPEGEPAIKLLMCDETGLGATTVQSCTEILEGQEATGQYGPNAICKQFTDVPSGLPVDGQCACIPDENTDNTCGPDGCGGKLKCAEGDYCDAADESCKKQVCIPGAVQCGINQVEEDLNLIFTCLPDGSGVSDIFTDCAFTGEICKQVTPTEAACVEAVCSPNQPYCATETGVVICDEYGHGPTGNVPTLCEAGQTCLKGECITDCDAHECGLCGGEFLGECGPSESWLACSEANDWGAGSPANSWCDDGQCVHYPISDPPSCWTTNADYESDAYKGVTACYNLCYMRDHDCGYHQPTQGELDIYGQTDPNAGDSGLYPLTAGDTCACTNFVSETETDATECPDNYVCEEGSCTALPCGHADYSGPPGSPCDDDDPDTLGDICLNNVCRGFTRFEVGVEGGGDSLAGVQYAHDRWFVIYSAGGIQQIAEVNINTGATTFDIITNITNDTFVGFQEGFALSGSGDLFGFNPNALTGPGWENLTTFLDFGLTTPLMGLNASMDVYSSMWLTASTDGGSVDQAWWAGRTTTDLPVIFQCTGLEFSLMSTPQCTAYTEFQSSGGANLIPSDVGKMEALTGRLKCNSITQACETNLVLGSTVGPLNASDPNQLALFEFPSDSGGGVWKNAVDGWTSHYPTNYTQQVRDLAHCGDGKFLAVGASGYTRGRTGLGEWGAPPTGSSSTPPELWMLTESASDFSAIWPDVASGRAFVAGSYSHSSGVTEPYIWTASTASANDLLYYTGPNNWQFRGLFEQGSDYVPGELLDIWGSSDGTLVAVGHDAYDPETGAETGGETKATLYVRKPPLTLGQ